MSFNAVISERGVIGDLRYELYTLTDVSSSSSTVKTGMAKPQMAWIQNTTGTAANLINATISSQILTLTAENDNDDGKMFVIGH